MIAAVAPAMSAFPALARRAAFPVAVAVLAAVFGLLPAAPAAAQTSSVTITVAPTSLAEADVATDVTVTATLSNTQSSPTTVTLSLAGTANQGTDYSVVGTLPTITIPLGQTKRSATVVLTPTDDTFWEGDETIVVNGSATGGLAVSGVSLTLSDNDARPSIGFYWDSSHDPNSFILSEDSGMSTTFTLHAELIGGSTLEADTAITLSVEADSSAVLGTDYTGTLPAMEIEAGTTTDMATITVTPIDNTLRDGRRYIDLQGAADDHLGNAFVVGKPRGRISIQDDEPELGLSFSLNPTVLREADLVVHQCWIEG